MKNLTKESTLLPVLILIIYLRIKNVRAVHRRMHGIHMEISRYETCDTGLVISKHSATPYTSLHAATL